MKKITLNLLFICTMLASGIANAQFAESFDSGIPATWTVNNQDGGSNTWVAYGSNTHSGAGNVRITYESAAHEDYLISPSFLVTNGSTNRVSFWAGIDGTFWTETFQVKLSTTGTAAADFNVVLGSETATTAASANNYTQYTYDLSNYNGQNVYIAIVATDTDRLYLYVDDFVNDAPPVTVPNCATGIVSTPHATCGNFNNALSWNAVTSATGYKLSIGTTPGGTDVLNNQNVALATSYTFAGTANTAYYWKVTPYNGVGDATACTENTFTTAATPCYCTPAPSSVDNIGITNVTIGTINNTSGDEAGHYGDYSVQTTDVPQGLSVPFSITYETGYTYETAIWVDWNNDSDFNDAGEDVYTGTSTNANPTTLSGTFTVPGTASLGNHRMRIGGQDNGPVLACYTGTYGTFEDYTVNVIAASCVPPVGSASVSPDCGNNQFFIAINVASLGSGTPTITDGTTTIPVPATGDYQMGPYASGSNASLTLNHGSSAICNVNLGSFAYTCPPANDDCATAIVLTPGGNFAAHSVVATNVGATASAGETAPGCASYSGGDVWYSVVVPASGSLTFENNTETGGITDSAAAVYSGTCGALVLVDCDDSSSSDPDDHPMMEVTGRTPGEVLYYRVWEYGNNAFGQVRVSAYDASLGTASFDMNGFSAYPNPVKDVLNLSYTKEISNVSVHNLLGQQIMSKPVNATQSRIDLSALSSGTYLVKVTVDNLVQTIKIVKQ
ncbi:T9SS-dependent choice-of-anchor J family protein [Flavobacterium humi]|uniref:T9SS type A sorting domain-containing protein n=1 Tax=Flavobacterium humi TaxID=2562683 RepID=A0A4Z0L7J7_9FLAO|nr:choice-of-anchor J domain-containing protein [Flavobacterium humi]TGD58201.1 T9SS type A sorting domain-containing protein [Flavobacterium humi]